MPRALVTLVLEYRNKLQHETWGEACIAFGRWEAAVAVAAITGRYNAGEVRSPGGLLRKLIKLHSAGELRLDRTLRGLAARLVNQQSQSHDVAQRAGTAGTARTMCATAPQRLIIRL